MSSELNKPFTKNEALVKITEITTISAQKRAVEQQKIRELETELQEARVKFFGFEDDTTEQLKDIVTDYAKQYMRPGEILTLDKGDETLDEDGESCRFDIVYDLDSNFIRHQFHYGPENTYLPTVHALRSPDKLNDPDRQTWEELAPLIIELIPEVPINPATI